MGKKAKPPRPPRMPPSQMRYPLEYEQLMRQIGKGINALGMAVDYLVSAQQIIQNMATDKLQEAEQLKKIQDKLEEKGE